MTNKVQTLRLWLCFDLGPSWTIAFRSIFYWSECLVSHSITIKQIFVYSFQRYLEGKKCFKNVNVLKRWLDGIQGFSNIVKNTLYFLKMGEPIIHNCSQSPQIEFGPGNGGLTSVCAWQNRVSFSTLGPGLEPACVGGLLQDPEPKMCRLPWKIGNHLEKLEIILKNWKPT